MTVKQLLIVTCNCPECTAQVELNNETCIDGAGLPEGWYDVEVNGTKLHGCCALHTAAAALTRLGFESIALDMLIKCKCVVAECVEVNNPKTEKE